jgi:hypothetical protein
MFNTAYAHQIDTSGEIRAAINKRFHGKSTRYVHPPFSTLVQWVLSSDEYKVREANVSSISNDDVTEVWEFIDTVKVSSSDTCRSMLAAMVGSRDRESFRRSIGYPKTPPRAKVRGMKVPRIIPRMLTVGTEVRGVHSTIEDVILEDALHMALSSSDPVGSCRSLSASIRGWH